MSGRWFGWLPAAVIVLAAASSRAEDFEAGKSGSSIFSADCSTCHRSARGLAKGMDVRTLASFLREHYTTGPGPANEVAAYVLSGAAGGADERAPKPAAMNDDGTPRSGQKPSRQKPDAAAPGDAASRASKPRGPATAARNPEPEPPAPPAPPPSPDAKRDASVPAPPPTPGAEQRVVAAPPPSPAEPARPAAPAPDPNKPVMTAGTGDQSAFSSPSP